MSLITFQKNNSSCEIDTLGCGITKFVVAGKHILWSGMRPDGGKGFTHPCIPNFNLADGLPNHGPARKAEWRQVDARTFAWEMAEIANIYPAGIHATRTFTLDDQELIVTTQIENKGKKALPINIAEHHYFFCPAEQRSQVKVNSQPFDEGALAGQAHYLSLSNAALEIEIPQHAVIHLQVEGYGAFAQWSLPGSEFVCVEPIQVMPPLSAEFLTLAPLLQPGEKKIFRYSLSLA